MNVKSHNTLKCFLMGFIQIIYLATTKEGNCVYKHTQKKKEINVRKKNNNKTNPCPEAERKKMLNSCLCL